MKDDQLHRLDNRTAEQLLHGEPDATGVEELRALSALLQAAAAVPVVVGDPAPTPGEEAAAAAFRAGRVGVPQQARRRMPGSLKVVIGVAVALLFGGVAVAAQTGAIHLRLPGGQRSGPGGAQVSASAPADASTTPLPGELPDGNGLSGTAAGGQNIGAPSSSDPADAQAAAQSLRSLCITYQAAQQTHGSPHASDGLHRLVQAAGSAAAVADYCAELLGSGGTADTHAGSTTGSGATGKTPATSASPVRKAR